MAIREDISSIVYYLDGESVEEVAAVITVTPTFERSGRKITITAGSGTYSYTYDKNLTGAYKGLVSADGKLPIYATSISDEKYTNFYEFYYNDELQATVSGTTSSAHNWGSSAIISGGTNNVQVTDSSNNVLASYVYDVTPTEVSLDTNSDKPTPKSRVYATGLLAAPTLTVNETGTLTIAGGDDTVNYWNIYIGDDLKAQPARSGQATTYDLKNIALDPGEYTLSVKGSKTTQSGTLTNTASITVWKSKVSIYLDGSFKFSYVFYSTNKFISISSASVSSSNNKTVNFTLLPTLNEYVSAELDRPLSSVTADNNSYQSGYVILNATSQWITKVTYYWPDNTTTQNEYYGASYKTICSVNFENTGNFNKITCKIGITLTGSSKTDSISTDTYTISGINCSSSEDDKNRITYINLYVNPSGDVEHTIKIQYNGKDIISNLHEYQDITLTTEGQYMESDLKISWN